MCVSLHVCVFLCFFFLELYDDYTQAILMCVTNLPCMRILLKKTNTVHLGKKSDTVVFEFIRQGVGDKESCR